MTHTPGPWAYVNRTIVGWEAGEHICEMCGSASNPYHQADARLIAAAPELLDALRKLTARYERLCDSGDCGHPHDWRDDDDDYKPAAVVLAKVDGNQGE